MPSYTYSKLDSTRNEIRLLTLQPGKVDSPIQITISHEPFKVANERRAWKVLSADHHKSLPPGWRSAYTVEETRIIYNYGNNDGTDFSTWTHPDPEYRPSDKDKPYDEFTGCSLHYEALSYTWGLIKNSDIVYVVEESGAELVDLSSADTLSIGSNLAMALRDLRYSDIPRKLWIDAICINQNDLDECSAQVTGMDSIYRLADRVVVWLGSVSEIYKLAFSKLEYLGRQIEVTQEGYLTAAPGCTESVWFDPRINPFDDEAWQAVFQLINAPWFERIWVLQEIQMANSHSIITHGKEEVSWYLLRRAIHCVSQKKTQIPPYMLKATRRAQGMGFNRRGQSLSALLYISWSSKCALPVDKIYALLGMMPPLIASKVIPDYTTPAEEVYKSIFLEHVKLVHRLEIFGSYAANCQRESVASWIPDLFDSTETDPFPATSGACATGYSAASVEYTHANMLEAIGIYCATVSSVSALSVDTEKDFYDLVHSLDSDKMSETPYIGGGSLAEAYAWTLSFGHLRDRYPSLLSGVPSLQEFVEKVIQNKNSGSDNGDKMIVHNETIRLSRNRRLVSTKEGYVGFGPESSRPGDVIATFLGCSLPILLRPSPTSPNLSPDTYTVIGEIYVAGLMDGESVLGTFPSPWKVIPTPTVSGRWEPRYRNMENEHNLFDTHTMSKEDPRLGKLPEDWEACEVERTPDDPLYFAAHRNKVTGEVVNYDPRLREDALGERGVVLKRFRLV